MKKIMFLSVLWLLRRRSDYCHRVAIFRVALISGLKRMMVLLQYLPRYREVVRIVHPSVFSPWLYSWSLFCPRTVTAFPTLGTPSNKGDTAQTTQTLAYYRH